MLPNSEHLTVPGSPAGEPPDASGLWSELIADSFGPEGARQFWTRPNPLFLSSLPASDAPLTERLSFDLEPALDLEAARDREILVAEDPWNNGGLLIIPAAVARIDAAYITSIMKSRTVGDLRRNPRAWNVAAERYDNAREDEGIAADLIDDESSYDPYLWFGDDGISYVLPLARLRTAQCAPAALDSLAREDHAIGMDYEQAPWWSVDDQAAVVVALEEAGHIILRDNALADRYSNY